MNVRIFEPLQGGRVRAIASKSVAHRLLICAALAERETFIHCPESSEDIDATVSCLEALGAAVQYDNGGFIVTPVKRKSPAKSEALYTPDCRESGSTFRFILPVCGALGVKAVFKLSGRLGERPLSPLYDEMVSHGCTIGGQGSSALTCEGKLEHGTYTLPGNVSSQFVSGLLFALPLLNGDSEIVVTGLLESRSYVDMTLDALRSFGIIVSEEEGQVFRIPGGQTYASPGNLMVEGDWSNAACWLCAGAIGKKPVTCTGLNIASRQGDRAIVELLKSFGAGVSCGGGQVTVSPGRLRGVGIDAGNIPDLVPVLAAVAAVADGETIIRNAGRLKLKESDRLHTVTMSLSSLGADITGTYDGLVINGKEDPPGGRTPSFGDHRITMCAAVFSTVCSGSVEIENAEAVNKSYPGFWNDFTALGGKLEEY